MPKMKKVTLHLFLLLFICGTALAAGNRVDLLEFDDLVINPVSATWTEALDAGVIDLIADNLDDLLEKIHGMKVITESGELRRRAADSCGYSVVPS